MRDPLDLSVGELLDSLADPEDPIASSVLAAQVVAAAAALLSMAARGSDAPEASGLAAQAESVRARASGLVIVCAQAFAEASSRLRARAAADREAGTERDFLLGRALHRAAEGPASVAEAAGDVGLLALAVTECCEPDRIPDVRVACNLADGAARGCVGLVAINLVAGSDEVLLSKARSGAELAAEASRKLAGG